MNRKSFLNKILSLVGLGFLIPKIESSVGNSIDVPNKKETDKKFTLFYSLGLIERDFTKEIQSCEVIDNYIFGSSEEEIVRKLNKHLLSMFACSYVTNNGTSFDDEYKKLLAKYKINK